MEGSDDGNEKNKIFVIIVECCLKRKTPSYTVSSKPSSPFLAFECVEKVDSNVDFAASADGEGGGASVVSVARRGPLGREGA